MCASCLQKDKFIIGSILCYVLQGIITAVVFGWLLYFPNEIDIDSFTMDAVNWITINGLTGFGTTVAGITVIMVTSPFYLEIMSQIGIPLAFVVDVFVHGYKFDVCAVFGSILIILSFVVLEFNSYLQKCWQKQLLLKETEKSTDYGAISHIQYKCEQMKVEA